MIARPHPSPRPTSKARVGASKNSKSSSPPASFDEETPKKRGQLLVLGQRLIPTEMRSECLRLARRVFRAAQTDGFDVGLTFVHDLEMRALNRAWRKKDKPTDVLSFAAQEGGMMPGDEDYLGDLVISIDTARHQARSLGHSLAVEISVLVAHGMCHLAGLDHERGALEARRQAACEQTLLAAARLDVRASLIGRAM